MKKPMALLAGLIHQPGGLTAKEAVQAAKASIDELKIYAATEISKLVDDLVAVGAASLVTNDSAARATMLQEVYRLSNTIVGVAAPFGLRGLGVIAYSLCDLVDRLRSAGRWSAPAVKIHLDGMRLMHDTPQEEAEVDAMQRALRVMIEHIESVP